MAPARARWPAGCPARMPMWGPTAKSCLKVGVLDPKLCILDETDSGLDIDALRNVADGVNALRNKDRAVVVITHYQRLLNYIVPDKVHVLDKGRIIKSGGKELALELEAKGYEWIEDEAAVAQPA